MTAKEILMLAKDRVAAPGHWCQGSYGRDAAGNTCHYLDCNVVSFCTLGALSVVGREFEEYFDAYDILNRLVPQGLISWFNDDPNTTQADVLALFDRAIAEAA